MLPALFAGIGRNVINPPIGCEKVGLRLFGEAIQAIESDLTVTVLVLANETNRIALIACDLCLIPNIVVDDVRQRVGEMLNVPASHVMLNMSHTHSAPAFPGWMEVDQTQVAMKRRYQDDFIRWTLDAAESASNNLQKARIGAGWGESYIGVYRREIGANGREMLGEVPDHPIDPSVGVVRVDDLEGNPIAVLFSYGCHPVVVGPNSYVISADFPGPARAVIEKNLGGIALFMQGCGGNINPKVGIGYEVDCRDNKNRLGTMLGGEVLKVAAGIHTNLNQGERTQLWNIPNILFKPWIPIEGDTCTYLGAVEEVVKLEFSELPTLEQAKEIQQQWQKTLDERQQQRAQTWEIRVAAKYTDWSRKLVEAVEDGYPTVDLVLQAIRINDIVFASLNVEAFFESGLAIRERSPYEHTLVFGYTNGSIAYLPRAEDYPEGGWKLTERYALPDRMPQAYSLPVALHPDSEQVAVKQLSRLIQTLA
jgi:hypothetical protein